MAITLVQSKSATGTSGSPNLTLTSPSAAGNLLVAFLDTGQNSGNPTFAAPAGWLAQTELVNQTFVFRNGQVFSYENNPGGITSITFTATPAISGGWCLYVLELSGVATSSALEVEAQKVNLSGQGSATPNQAVTTTTNGDLVIGWCAGDAANNCTSLTGPATGGWTNLTSITDANGFERAICSYVVQATAGAITYTATSSGVTDYLIAVIAFKAAAGGGSTVNGSGALIANSVLAETAAQVIAANTPVQANSVLTETGARVVTTAAAVQSTSALVETAAQVTTPNAPLFAQSALIETTARLTNPHAPVVANSVLADTTAQIIITSAPLPSNSIIQATATNTQALPTPVVRSVLVVASVTARSVVAGATVVTAKTVVIAASSVTAKSVAAGAGSVTGKSVALASSVTAKSVVKG